VQAGNREKKTFSFPQKIHPKIRASDCLNLHNAGINEENSYIHASPTVQKVLTVGFCSKQFF
jgi:hypothetical protein